MKNSLNLVLVILLFVVIGCSCPNMDEISKKIDESATPRSTPLTSDSPTDSVKSSKAGVTQDNFNKLKDDMTYKEVVEILGSEGKEVTSYKVGKTKIVTYQWEGDSYAYIFANFTDDKLTYKSNANLK